MIEGMKRSLDYFTVHFSPFQFKQLRILEFPAYATFAQSFANTIPYPKASASSPATTIPRTSTWSLMSPLTRLDINGGRIR